MNGWLIFLFSAVEFGQRPGFTFSFLKNSCCKEGMCDWPPVCGLLNHHYDVFFFFFQPSASVWWTRHISGAHRGLLFLLKWCFVFCSWIESWWILMNTHSDDFRNCTKLSGGLADGHKVLPICFCCIKISLMFLSELHLAKKKKKSAYEREVVRV